MKIFISYTSSDRGWAHWIGWQLREKKHIPFVHEWEIGAGEDIPKWMEERLDEADRFLAVCSDSYCRAEYSQLELRAAIWRDPTGDRGFLVPVEVRKVTNWPTLIAHRSRCSLLELGEDKAVARLMTFLGPRGPSEKPDYPPSVEFIKGGEALSSSRPVFPPSDKWPLVIRTIAGLIAFLLILSLLGWLFASKVVTEKVSVLPPLIAKANAATSNQPDDRPELEILAPVPSNRPFVWGLLKTLDSSKLRVWDRRTGEKALFPADGSPAQAGGDYVFVFPQNLGTAEVIDRRDGSIRRSAIPIRISPDILRPSLKLSDGYLGVNYFLGDPLLIGDPKDGGQPRFELWSFKTATRVNTRERTKVEDFDVLGDKDGIVVYRIYDEQSQKYRVTIQSVAGGAEVAVGSPGLSVSSRFIRSREEVIIWQQNEVSKQTSVQVWSIRPPRKVADLAISGMPTIQAFDDFIIVLGPDRVEGILNASKLNWEYRFENQDAFVVTDMPFHSARGPGWDVYAWSGTLAWRDKNGNLKLWRGTGKRRGEVSLPINLEKGDWIIVNQAFTKLILGKYDTFEVWDLEKQERVATVRERVRRAHFTDDSRAILVLKQDKSWYAYDIDAKPWGAWDRPVEDIVLLDYDPVRDVFLIWTHSDGVHCVRKSWRLFACKT